MGLGCCKAAMSIDPIRITARQQLAGEKICGSSSPPPGVSDKEVRGYRALERCSQLGHRRCLPHQFIEGSRLAGHRRINHGLGLRH